MSQLEHSQFLNLPSELLLCIISLLSHEDQQTFSLLSHSSRQLVSPVLFKTLSYTQNVPHHIAMINQAGEDLKASIRELLIDDVDHWDYSNLFRLIQNLPKLQIFRWSSMDSFTTEGCYRCTCLPELVAALQYCPLEQFTYWISILQGPVAAPPRLKSLSVKCHHAHVYDLIRSSFSTLVELEIFLIFDDPFRSVVFDLLPLRPLGRTLQRFVYKVDGFDSGLLDSIPEVFPHLTDLELMVLNVAEDLLWKQSYDDAIAKNSNLQYLAVSALHFVYCNDPEAIHKYCQDCVDGRAKATHALAMACTRLKCCRWHDRRFRYLFNVKRSSVEGNTAVQVEGKPSTDTYRHFGYCR